MHKPKSSPYPRRVAVAGALTSALLSTTAYAQQCVVTATATCSITNTQNIVGDIDITVPDASANRVVITNSGNVSGYIFIEADDDDIDQFRIRESFSFTNSGALTVARPTFEEAILDISTQHRNVSVTNSGTITGVARTGLLAGGSLVSIANESPVNSVTSFTNSGIISTTAYGATGVAIGAVPDDGEDGIVNGMVSSQASVVNSGTISAAGGALLHAVPIIRTDSFGRQFAIGNTVEVEVAAGLAVGAVSVGTTSQVAVTNQAGGKIEAGGAVRLGSTFASFATGGVIIVAPRQGNTVIADAPTDFGTVALAVYGNDVTITNDGLIKGGVGSQITATGVEFRIPDIEMAYFNDEALLTFPNRYLAGAIHSFAGGRDTVTNSATGIITGSIDLGLGDDRIVNTGSIIGQVFLREGNDTYVRGIAATQTGTVDGGAGTDTVLIDITAGGTFTSALYAPFTNFESFGTTGNGAVRFDGALPFATLQVNGRLEVLADSVLQTTGPIALMGSTGTDTVINRGTIVGIVDLGAGNDVFQNFGSAAGPISLGAGDDRFETRLGSTTGPVAGGAGTNTIALHMGGTLSAPQAVGDLSGYTGFQNLIFAEGNSTVGQALSFDRIDVTAGSLFGLATSTIAAPNGIFVGAGATFGSAGRVTGPVTVAGTLAPGASPGTMQVTGNVALQTGSTTVFEFTPTVSDRLLITGQLSIATGATLNITGSRPLTPGVTYNLITASGGISGTFSTINKAATVLGFLRQGANTLDLLGTLQLRAGGTPPVAAAVNYLNAALTGGTATPALVNAFPALVGTDGFAREAAVATLHPEAYASASQIGIENGIAIADSLRTHSFAPRQSGAYTFAHALGSWRKFGANALSGTSRANIRSSGILGGLGFGGESFAISAFVGHASARQPIAALGARTASKGVFAGAHLDFSTDMLGVGGSLIYDGGKATTARTLFDSTALTSGYRLRSVTVDGYARLKVALGGSWQFGPEIGLTHVSVKRGAATEAGSGFALTVAKAQDKASFVRGQVSIARNAPDGFSPWLSAGVRHRTGRGGPIATASFAGVASTFTVSGVERTRTVGTGSAGFNARLSDSISLFGRAEHEFGQNGSTAASAGFRLSF